MQIISECQRHHETFYLKTYVYAADKGCGYSFNCDENGNIDIESMNPDAKANYECCLAGVDERGERIKFNGVRQSEHSWIEDAIGLCDCGEEVELGGFTNTCEKCGTDYNSSGQRLAPRSQWGEETGEHPADIARIP